MGTKIRMTDHDLKDQIARIRQIQAELDRIQLQLMNVVKDSKLNGSPAILVAKLLVGYAALLCVGIAIGMLV
jgi:hypothetical protein